jgi:hypothetical protein
MDDRFLKDARQEPRPEFARNLRERLRAQESRAEVRRKAPARFVPALGGLAAVLIAVGLFSIPAVRATAQGFLDLFRVRNFAAVTVDPARLQQIKNQTLDVESILGQPETIQDPGPLRVFTNATEAASATGYVLKQAPMVNGFVPDSTFVRGESRKRLRVDTTKLRNVLTALAIDDVTLPPALDGAEVNVHIQPVARTVYKAPDNRRIFLLQTPSPELSLPPGNDATHLGEIGLRIAGLNPGEARKFAQSVDWHSTMLVPVPSGASSFREVTVRGNKGLLIAFDPRQDLPRRPKGGSSQLLWSDGERVFALVGKDVSDVMMVELANQVQ